ncbi:hypothetical protein CIW60_06305 [Enterobacter roggenkampii]|uniref:hypothetical protein n=1 Tax=Enterobacter TaxID=547 RepID=UPI0008DD5462|nr:MULTISPECIES: hypothetical protein [Enterobacter]MCK7257600.1 hypothetical protein [Enterobacter asburiae]MCU6346869.1 hypothetical protein [Enterobacter quasiroggenkampii]OHY53820.1 hypothetical protein BBX43_07500 [Enterobacter roggenkampii]OHY63422.1 hypothetical protein BB775_12570 [Enterobacter roggenkampii]PAO11867.1 hypothetical protein CIW60_06305 [Enterobacter roggenkampii]
MPDTLINHESVIDMLNSSPVLSNLNLRCVKENNERIVRIDKLEAFHLGGLAGDSYNGMFVVSMLELALGFSGVEYFYPEKSGVIEMSYKFWRVIPSKVEIFAKSTLIKKSENICFCQAKVLDRRGREYAFATGIVSKF